jgi:Type VI secretion system effector, Hcp
LRLAARIGHKLRLSRAQDRDVRHSHASGYAQNWAHVKSNGPVMTKHVERELTNQATDGGETELTEHELRCVSGGAVGDFLKIDGIDGESQDDKHKNEIQIGSYAFGRR